MFLSENYFLSSILVAALSLIPDDARLGDLSTALSALIKATANEANAVRFEFLGLEVSEASNGLINIFPRPNE